MIDALTLATALLIGLMGGAHCLGMCGGIAAAISMSTVNESSGNKGAIDKTANSFFLLGYNAGRIISYAIAGAILGSLSWLIDSLAIQVILRSFAGVMLILMGCYIAQWWQVLTHLERAGQRFWRHISPAASKLLPVKNLKQAIALGLIWGWLPCGLVYSTLIWASAAGDWLLSAQLMLAFGVGTLPAMLITGVLAQQVKQLMQHKISKSIAGSSIILMGILTIPWHGIMSL